MSTPDRRARLAFAVAAREAADYSRSLVGDLAVELGPHERIHAARRLRVLALAVLDRAVLVELAAGTTWEELSDALGLPADEVRRRYADTFARWSDEQPGGVYLSLHADLDADSDPAGMAEAIDAWYGRHAEPWETPAERPVTRSIG